MSIGDLFKGKENTQLKARVAQLEAMLTPEMQDSVHLQELIAAQQSNLANLQQQLADMQKKASQQTAKAQQDLNRLNSQIEQAKTELVETNEEVLMQSFGLYKPHFAFANSTEYKDELSKIRTQQKECIKAGRAATGRDDWTVNGDKRKGAKMIHDMQKLLIRTFNCECDDVIDHVKFNNIEAAEKRIESSFSAISKLGTICGVAITGTYRDLKIKELHLAYEYQVEKQKEKEGTGRSTFYLGRFYATDRLPRGQPKGWLCVYYFQCRCLWRGCL